MTLPCNRDGRAQAGVCVSLRVRLRPPVIFASRAGSGPAITSGPTWPREASLRSKNGLKPDRATFSCYQKGDGRPTHLCGIKAAVIRKAVLRGLWVQGESVQALAEFVGGAGRGASDAGDMCRPCAIGGQADDFQDRGAVCVLVALQAPGHPL